MPENSVGSAEQAVAPETGQTAITDVGQLRAKMKLTGTVRRVELYGAFVDIGVGVDAVLHVSKLGKRVNRVSDLLNVGDQISVWVAMTGSEREPVMLTMVEPLGLEWNELREGLVCQGKVTRLEQFGAFVDIGAEKEGLVHVSELSHDYVTHPSEAVKVGDEIEVQVIGFNKKKRRIDLSRKSLIQLDAAVSEAVDVDEEDFEEEETLPTAMEMALRQAMASEDPASVRGQSHSRKRKTRKRKMREQQDDILSRTLRMGGGSTNQGQSS